MRVPYNKTRMDDLIDVEPVYSTDDFAVIPHLSVDDGQAIDGMLSLIHVRTGGAIVNAAEIGKERLIDAAFFATMSFPQLAGMTNVASVKKYARRCKEFQSFIVFRQNLIRKLAKENML